MIGSAFLAGKVRIGRNRLPAGVVAHLDDAEGLTLAIRDLHAYAIQPGPVKIKHSVVFKIVAEQERDAVNHKIQNIYGTDRFADISADFCPALGHYHIMDSEHIAHVCNRHSDAAAEHKRGHLPIVASDFELVPLAISPKNIQEFQMTGDSPRIIYAMELEAARLIVIEEFSRKRGLIFKTAYKQKNEGRRGHPVGKWI